MSVWEKERSATRIPTHSHTWVAGKVRVDVSGVDLVRSAAKKRAWGSSIRGRRQETIVSHRRFLSS